MYGLVLEGGGTKGAYQIGVYKALLESGIEIGGVAGTSIGALNGAMIVQGDYKKAYNIWYNIKHSMIINVTDEDVKRLSELKWDREDISFVKDKLKNVLIDRGLDVEPFRHSLEMYIDEEKIRKSGMDFGMVTVNLSELKPIHIFVEDMGIGKLKDYLMASSYLPVFKFERLGGNLYLDGGFYDKLPFKMLRDKGYKKLILVRTQPKGIVRKIKLEGTDSIIISPSEELGGMLQFDQARSRYNLELGYYDGLKAVNDLKGRMYYINPNKDEDYYLRYLLNIKKEGIKSIQNILNLPDLDYRRSLFENIIPKLYSMLPIDSKGSYEDLLIALLEIKAEGLGINRFKVYSFQELLVETKKEEIQLPKEEHNTLDKIIGKVDIMSFFNREEILSEISNIIISN